MYIYTTDLITLNSSKSLILILRLTDNQFPSQPQLSHLKKGVPYLFMSKTEIYQWQRNTLMFRRFLKCIYDIHKLR